MPPSKITVGALATDSPFIGAAVCALVLVGSLVWLAFGSSSVDDTTTKKPFTHMHCSECREETVYSPRFAGRKCEACGKGTYEPTVGSIFDEEAQEGSNFGRIILFVVVTVICVQGLFFFGTRRLATLRSRAEDELNRTLIARCPFCQRKVAYPIKKAGTFRTCTQCKTAFELPADSASDHVV